MVVGHVYVTICGFGKRIVPARSPFEVEMDPDGAVAITVSGKRALVAAGHAPAGRLSGTEVADVIVGPVEEAWWIDAGAFRILFPAGWTVFADGGLTPPFFLLGSLEQSVFIQTAAHVPTGEDLVASYQVVVDRTQVGPYESLELAYQSEGIDWRQRHTVLTLNEKPRAVLTAQAPASAFAEARALHVSIADRIVFA